MSELRRAGGTKVKGAALLEVPPRIAKEQKMFPASLSCEVKALSPIGPDPYHNIVSMWAKGEAPEVARLEGGVLFSWHEKIHMTFGESRWYRDINPLTLNSRRAIGILRQWHDSELVATVSALPAVTSALSASLPRVLEKIAGKEIISRGVRVKLGSFLNDHYDRIKDQIVFMEFMDGNGQRYSTQREHKSPHIMAQIPADDSLRKIWADSDSKAEQTQLPSLLALGLTWKESYWVLNHTFSAQIFDVASTFEDIALRIGEITELVVTYLDKVEG